MELTLSIIKPDAIERNLIGKINEKIEASGLKIIAAKMLRLTKEEAEAFYAVHRKRPFFKDLVQYMISGPVMVQVLMGKDAITTYRQLMGATDPQKAEAGTIRCDFAENVERNCVHGSDGPDTAASEIAFFFAGRELLRQN